METELLIARIKDTADISLKTTKPKYFGFVSSEQAALANRVLKKQNCEFDFSGGHENAERVLLGCFPDWDNNRSFPIGSLTFKYRTADKLSHRDILGSLMALGLKREAVGDILVGEGRAIVFVVEEIKDYIKTQLSKIGRTGVTVEEGYSLPLPQTDCLTSFSDTIASSRLDCVVSALAGLSRSKADSVITDGYVSINSVVCDKSTKTVADNDIVTIRGKGKFIIDSLERRTKKNRTIINYKKYM